VKLDAAWHAVRINLSLYLLRPAGYLAIAGLVLWAVSVRSIGVNKAQLAARTSELGYAPLSEAQLSGLGAGQVASGFMTLVGIWLIIDNLDRERERGLDELLGSLPVSGPRYVALQYVANVATLLALAAIAYLVGFVAHLLRGSGGFAPGAYLWPSVAFTVSNALLLGSLPLLLDGLNAHHVVRGIAYGLIAIGLNLIPFALGAISNLDHPRHPLFQVWLTAHLGLDTFGVWYLQGYLDLVLQVAKQTGAPDVPASLLWTVVVRPRLACAGLGLLCVALAAWRFNRFQVAPEG
jgi:ABC-type transport system involved in multi-copper enzyme maturation permease subunit